MNVTLDQRTLENAGKLLLRLTVGGLMLFHGLDKIRHGITGIENMLVGAGIPEFLAYGVYAGEIVAPLLLIIGYQTRAAATVFAFNMLVATLLAHSGDILSMNQFGGWAIELQMLYLLGAVTIALVGAGQYSIQGHSRVKGVGAITPGRISKTLSTVQD